jgi:hypothetical protein
MTWSWRQADWRRARALLGRRGARPAPLPPSSATPDGRPTRPDRLSIWPTEEDTFGIDVLYHGPQGRRRAEVVRRQIAGAGHPASVRAEGESGWIVRFGPVGRDEMLLVLNGFVW